MGELTITDYTSIMGQVRTFSRSTPAGMIRRRTMNNGDGSRVFNIDDGNAGNLLDVSISGLTLTGGDVTGGGGAISHARKPLRSRLHDQRQLGPQTALATAAAFITEAI